jgi:ankyrin repeat protein
VIKEAKAVTHAVGKVHGETVRALLEQEDRGTHTGEKTDALMRAAMIGDARSVRMLLDLGASPNTREGNGRTVLMEAAYGSHTDTIMLLLERGAEVNAQDSTGWTALMEAASKGHTAAVRLLLFYGADPALRTRHGWTALSVTPRSICWVRRSKR